MRKGQEEIDREKRMGEKGQGRKNREESLRRVGKITDGFGSQSIICFAGVTALTNQN